MHSIYNRTDRPPLAEPPDDGRTGLGKEALKQAILDNLFYLQGKFPGPPTRGDYYRALAFVVRDRMLQRWISTAAAYTRNGSRTDAYLSAEFLMGPHLGNNLVNLGIYGEAQQAVAELMHLRVDENGIDWKPAREITRKSLAYTNHTLLPEALERWRTVKRANKQRFARLVQARTGIAIDAASMCDVQVNRIHEYRRQHLTILQVIGQVLVGPHLPRVLPRHLAGEPRADPAADAGRGEGRVPAVAASRLPSFRPG